MKKSFLLMGALCVGAAFVSCVDDSESDEVKELRQVQLDSKKASLDEQYWDFYNDAVDKVKTYQKDMKDAQMNLDAAKDGKLTLEAGKAAAVAYQQQVIARNQKDIEDKKAEIEVQKAMAGKSYEDIQKAKITSANAAEKAAKDAQDYWLDLTNKGYNQSYDEYGGSSSVDIDEATDMLLGDYWTYGSLDVKYRNNKLSENEWVKAMNAIYCYEVYSYIDGNNLPSSSDEYEFYYTDEDDDPGTGYYYATSMFSSQTIEMKDNNGYSFQTYTKYTFKDVDKYQKALNEYVKKLKDAKDADPDNIGYATAYNQYKALQDKITGLIDILSDEGKYTAYENALKANEGYANEIRSLLAAYDKADAIADAYDNYYVSNNESTVATLEDAIKGYNDNIDAANKTINETINNGITDQETLIAYYTTLIAELKSEIAANQAVADKYRALIAGSGSSNNQQQQQSTPAPEQTPAE